MGTERRIYRISPWRRAVFWCLVGPFMALGLALVVAGEDEPTRTAGIVVALIIGAFLAAWEWLLSRTYLELTAVGVELHQLGMHVRAPWSDVAVLSLRRGREGFIVDASLEGKGVERLAALRGIGAYGAPFYDAEQRALLGERRFIPIEAFAWHARHGTLAQEIVRVAPHVRLAEDRTTPAPLAARKLVWVAAVIVAAGGIGTALATSSHGALAMLALQALVAPLALSMSGISTLRAFRSRAFLVGALLAASTLLTLGWTVLTWQGLAEVLRP